MAGMVQSFLTAYSSRKTVMRAAVGTETRAPTMPARAVPSNRATRMVRPMRLTLERMMRGMRTAFSRLT